MKAPAYAPLFPYLAARRNAGLLAEGELVIDNFAGWGGASVGIEAALGRPVDHAINHDPVAVSMHRVNHPHSHHSVEDVWQVDPREVTKGQPVALCWFSPTCFPAGTLVLTARGYLPIEEVQVGDQVLTHESRWRVVTHTMQAQKPTRTLSGFGQPALTTTHEHPFWIAERPSKYQMKLSPAQWVAAGKLEARKHYWALPKRVASLPVPEIGGRGMQFDEHLLWLAGRYVADGYATLKHHKSEIMLACGNSKLDEMRERLTRWPRTGERAGFNELAWGEMEQQGAVRFFTTHRGLTEWLVAEFGKVAHGKRLPAWLFGLSEKLRQAFLDGYLSGDGWKGGNIVECSTVSRDLAFGLKTLLGTLGHAAAMYQTKQRNNIIQGRTVNVRDVYTLKWRLDLDSAHQQHGEDDDHLFTRIRKITDSDELQTVYNISVEEDESYVVDGIVVHNCTHFSKAKGAALLDRGIRGLAWVAVRWADLVQPRVIILENVEEFRSWGPLTPEGRPDPRQTGRTFNSFVNALRRLGYEVEWRELRACDYGTPTIRKRLFLVARRDGLPIVWPAPTHAAPTDPRVQSGLLEPYRTAAECIDWSLPAPSIFDRKKPLVRNTLNRIAQGLRRFVLESEKPFIVTCNHSGAGFRGQDIDEPFRTVTAAHEAHGAVDPVLAPVMLNKQHQAPSRPLSTITTNHNKNELVQGYLVPRYGERDNQQPRAVDVEQPSPTVVTTGNGSRLAVAHLTKFRKASPGQGAGQPLDTVSAGGEHFGIVASHIVRHNGGGLAPEHAGYRADEPARTVLATGGPQALVSGALVACGGRGAQARPKALDETMHTITSKADMTLTTAHLTAYYSRNGEGDQGQAVTEPLRTIPTVDRFGPVTTTCATSLTEAQLARAREVAAFLREYLTSEQLAPYLHGDLVTLRVRGELYVLADIGMRMLTPRELASCQGFPEDYELEEDAEGNAISKTRQVRGIGNSVCPQLAETLTRAQLTAVMSEAAD